MTENLEDAYRRLNSELATVIEERDSLQIQLITIRTEIAVIRNADCSDPVVRSENINLRRALTVTQTQLAEALAEHADCARSCGHTNETGYTASEEVQRLRKQLPTVSGATELESNISREKNRKTNDRPKP